MWLFVIMCSIGCWHLARPSTVQLRAQVTSAKWNVAVCDHVQYRMLTIDTAFNLRAQVTSAKWNLAVCDHVQYRMLTIDTAFNGAVESTSD